MSPAPVLLLPARETPFVSIVIVGNVQPPLWHWETWQRCVGSFDALIGATGARAAVRTFQSQRGEQRWLPFGKLDWTPKHHERWLLGAPGSARDPDTHVFYGTEIWAPRWTECLRRGRAPRLFLGLGNPHHAEDSLGRPHDSHTCLLHVGMAVPVARTCRSVLETAVADLARTLSSTLVMQRVAPWWPQGGDERVDDTLTSSFGYGRLPSPGAGGDPDAFASRPNQPPWHRWGGEVALSTR